MPGLESNRQNTFKPANTEHTARFIPSNIELTSSQQHLFGRQDTYQFVDIQCTTAKSTKNPLKYTKYRTIIQRLQAELCGCVYLAVHAGRCEGCETEAERAAHRVHAKLYNHVGGKPNTHKYNGVPPYYNVYNSCPQPDWVRWIIGEMPGYVCLGGLLILVNKRVVHVADDNGLFVKGQTIIEQIRSTSFDDSYRVRGVSRSEVPRFQVRLSSTQQTQAMTRAGAQLDSFPCEFRQMPVPQNR